MQCPRVQLCCLVQSVDNCRHSSGGEKLIDDATGEEAKVLVIGRRERVVDNKIERLQDALVRRT